MEYMEIEYIELIFLLLGLHSMMDRHGYCFVIYWKLNIITFHINMRIIDNVDN